MTRFRVSAGNGIACVVDSVDAIVGSSSTTTNDVGDVEVIYSPDKDSRKSPRVSEYPCLQ